MQVLRDDAFFRRCATANAPPRPRADAAGQVENRRPPRETKTVGGKAPKAPEAADAGQYAITGEEKSTAKKREKSPLGGGNRAAWGGWDVMSRRGHGSSLNPLKRQGAGKSQAVKETFFQTT